MSQFKDSNGNTWDLRFSTPVFIRICRKLNLTLQKLISLDIPIADALEAIPLALEGQLKDRNLTAEKFLEGLGPKELMEATKALGAAIKEAFPSVKIGRQEDGSPVPFVPGS